ncbi:MAG: hypothetical protein JO359_08740 [Candidatus Eremiobacteraeota bacterium]|nr:hypothetical protein [Candidatus Eremiobacteraeota bacterium]
MHLRAGTLLFVLVALAAVVAACGGTGSSGAAALPQAARSRSSASSPIQHVVIVIQENRSFENFFAGYPGADAPMSGKLHTGATIQLKPITFATADVHHLYKDSQTQWDGGKNDGFDKIPVTLPPVPTYAYSYVKRSLVQPYWTIAKQYTLADRMFSTIWGASFTAHQALISGSTAISNTAALVDVPFLTSGGSTTWRCDAVKGTVTSLLTSTKAYETGAGPFPCLSYPTIYDSLDAAGVSWLYYDSTSGSGSGLWDAPDAIHKIYYGPDNKKVVYTKNQILTDAQAGNLPAVSWVIPDALNSDHPGIGSDTGPSWVAQVVNAIGTGPQWKQTAIIVVWDEWGGWYDNVNPPQLYYYGLGFRVPCLIVSPYARSGYVSHTQYEFGSILKTIEKLYGLQPIGGYADDATANDMLDSFDFKKQPGAFKPIPAKYSMEYFKQQKPSGLPVDNE